MRIFVDWACPEKILAKEEGASVMNTQFGKWLLAGVMAVSMTVANQRAHAHGDGTAEAVVTGLAIGAVAATLVRDDDHHHHHHHTTYREVHHYYDEPRYHRHDRYCGHRVEVNHYYRGGHGHGHRPWRHHGGHHGSRYDRPRSVIVNHF